MESNLRFTGLKWDANKALPDGTEAAQAVGAPDLEQFAKDLAGLTRGGWVQLGVFPLTEPGTAMVLLYRELEGEQAEG